jgi:HAD superfamily hydrolase (TIGR01509 family)
VPAAAAAADAVVFDIDGLLLDTEESWTLAERTLFGRRGREFTAEHKRVLVGTSAGVAAVLFEEMLDAPGQGRALIAELGMLVFAEMGRYAPPRPGALELLGRLRDAGIPMSLASNSPRMLADRALATAGVDQSWFVSVRTADEVEHPKPAPDLYLASCSALGTPPSRTLALEDSPTGVASARAAGCYTIGIPSLEGVELGDADLIVGSLADPAITRALGL